MTQDTSRPLGTSRTEAVYDLERIEVHGAYAGLSRRGLGRNAAGSGKLTDLVFGVTRWRRWLDFLIDSFYKGDAAALELRLRIILRIGLYEMLLTRVPDHAAVNEAVVLAKKMIGKRATGLVNAILRSAGRKRDSFPEPDGATLADRLAVRYSHPTWMTDRWVARYGESDTIQLLERNNQRPHFGLRIRKQDRRVILDRLQVAGARPIDSPFLSDFLRVEVLQPVFKEGLIDEGAVLVQDEAAGAVVRVLDPQPGERILDVCAAPGGKSIYIADLVGASGSVVGVDQSESRLNLLSSEASRLGLSQISTHTADFTSLEPADLGGTFDRVLVDAPCSGLGVLAKRADLRWRIGPEEIKALQELQERLLSKAAEFVRPGGLLVYSTCTIEPEENTIQAKLFIENSDDYALYDNDIEGLGGLLNSGGMLESLPHKHGIDGAFAARFRKNG